MSDGGSLPEDPGFAPKDLTDGRDRWDWRSRWPPEATKQHQREFAYLLSYLLLLPLITVVIWNGSPRGLLGVDEVRYETFALYSYGAVGGALGGALFSCKWLYHSVAHGSWHQDRWLWRVLTPLISCGLAVAVLALALAGIVPLIDVSQIKKPAAALGFSFLVGYFSDNALASLARVAKNVLGQHGPD